MDLLKNGSENAKTKIILAHGAGAPMDSPFMVFFAEKLAELGHETVRFEFPYMQQRRETGSKRPPDRQPKLLERWQEVIGAERNDGQKLIIGGKSMGGRMASLIADEVGADGLVCLGYPFYAMGKPDKPRIDHLMDIKTPTLIAQGERDTMGNRENVAKLTLASSVEYHWLPDGDHSFKPRKASGRTEEENWLDAMEAVDQFVQKL
ncbi:alpha/beta hydrolase [Sneathiella sp. P13V-1]|uniref:alpha/beta family hydrolase n=1 Tax=Sneathiella sp. P13V-1 TaxID=2697366 RepID=UPI00187B7913|nr:alpha/beta family hydrolase [Sneathiella sp. P13V-1]MBE7636462.1 alpha/beta hydrolase [Sneathiella sp. P13V-1]